jgi:HPt (histidine-containing phosphotransfer) domain-containing protein
MNDPLAGLRARFIDRLRDDLEVLSSGAPPRPLVHRMAGTAGMLGFPDLGRLAAVVDDQLAQDQTPDRADWEALLAAMTELTRTPG